MRIKQIMLIFFGIAILSIGIGTAAPDTITVNNSTGLVADFTSIQSAVNASFNGDLILVYPGIYKENVFVNK